MCRGRSTPWCWLRLAMLVAAVACCAPAAAAEDSADAAKGDRTEEQAGGDHDQEGDGHAPGDHGEGGHGGHHDPLDLSGQNATALQDKPDELRSDLAIWTAVVFVLLLALLAKFAWGPIMDGLQRREQAIADQIENAHRSSEKAAALLKQYEAKLAQASDEVREMMAQARRDAESAKERILAEARTAAERERERAVADINVAKSAALQEMTEKSVDLAVVVAGRMIRRQLNTDDRATLIREALDQLPSAN